jgi:hypothetical protein
MAYEVFTRTAVRVDEPSISLVPGGRVAFNAAACRILLEAGVRSALLMWDKRNKRLAIKAAAKGDKNSYAVSMVKGSYSGSIRAASFFGYIGWNAPKRTMLPATWNAREKMFEVALPREYVNSTRPINLRQNAKTAG